MGMEVEIGGVRGRVARAPEAGGGAGGMLCVLGVGMKVEIGGGQVSVVSVIGGGAGAGNGAGAGVEL
jgi:hypothetical protein